MSDSKTYDFRPMRIWGINLEFEERKPGDITAVSYSSHSKIVHIEYRLQHTSSVWITTEYGFGKFMAVRRMMNRVPSKISTWRKVSVRYLERMAIPPTAKDRWFPCHKDHEKSPSSRSF